MEETDNTAVAINFMIKLNEFQHEIIKSMNYIRGDIHDFKDDLKGEISELRKELRDYKEENNRRWEESDKRWEENDKRWEKNEARWEKYEANRKEDKKFLLDALTSYDISISEQLGDPNVSKMRKSV